MLHGVEVCLFLHVENCFSTLVIEREIEFLSCACVVDKISWEQAILSMKFLKFSCAC